MQDRECHYRSNSKAYQIITWHRDFMRLAHMTYCSPFQTDEISFQKRPESPPLHYSLFTNQGINIWFLYLFIKSVLFWGYPWDVENPL